MNGLSRTIPVVVTRTKDQQVLEEIAKLNPPLLQLHAHWLHDELASIRRILSPSTKLIGVVALDDGQPTIAVRQVADECDYILFDNAYVGGTGLLLNWKLLEKAAEEARNRNIRFFIAGGLTPENVSYYIRAFTPYGVDVQTGVEVDGKPGVKDLIKVKRFVDASRSS
jgi:phosphoribosylanthranilate isomerase